MALLDLSLVTKTLVEVVKRAIAVSPAKPAQQVNVTGLPPDKLTDEDNVIGLYMYHLVEEAAQKNKAWRGRPDQPIRFSPIGLNLHYIVSAHSKSAESEGPYREQLLMGLTTKALHDFPIVDDDTMVGGFKVMPPAMLGDENKLRLALRHVPPNEAVSYWTAGSQPLRLSTYYEVAVVLVEPEEPAAAAGRILTWGVDTFIGGLPRLLASRSNVTFTIPGESAPRVIEVQPAQAAIGDAFTLVGSALGGGALELLVRGPGVPDPRPVGPSWGASSLGDEVTAAVQADIDGAPSLPGTYAAALRITRTRTLADGSTRSDVIVSNDTPFQIVPAVTAVGAPSATGVFEITGQIFADPSITTVRASIGGVHLAAGVLNALHPGEFAVRSATAIQMRLPAGSTSGQWLPVRVVIEGSESPPRWVQAP